MDPNVAPEKRGPVSPSVLEFAGWVLLFGAAGVGNAYNGLLFYVNKLLYDPTAGSKDWISASWMFVVAAGLFAAGCFLLGSAAERRQDNSRSSPKDS
jgi:hypothetical protein